MPKIKELLAAEFYNYFNWLPVSIAIGIFIFFKLPYDPPYWFSLILAFFGLALLLIAIFYSQYFIVCMLITAMLAGFIAAHIRTYLVLAPRISEKMEGIFITGKVAEIDQTEKGQKILLEELAIRNLDKNNLPQKIKLTARSKLNVINIGDVIRFRATLIPPPEPTIPQGFDYAEFAFFKQIGAIGYITSKIRVMNNEKPSLPIIAIEHLRQKTAERLQTSLSPTAAGIAQGMLIGKINAIDQKDFEAIRVAGIAHIISISGMHIVVVVGLIFIATRSFLKRWQFITLRYNTKKIAAISAIFGSFFYLLIAGSPLSGQRAFIMSSLVLLGIMLDRQANPLRSITIAAIILLLCTPEAIKNPGLQMSFAACLALIVSFTFSQKIFTTLSSKKGALKKALGYIASITVSTLVAGTAAAPFVIYHFKQYSTYSVLTNIIAIPLSDFYIMPLGILSMLLMPFSLEKLTLFPMEWGINLLLASAKYISSLPQASLFIPAFTNTGLALVIIGGLIIFLCITNLRHLGTIPIIIGTIVGIDYSLPNIAIDKSGKLFAFKHDKQFIFSNKKYARFVRTSWVQAFGQEKAISLKETNITDCTPYTCKLVINDYPILITAEENNLEHTCKTSHIFINVSQKDFTCNHAPININLKELKTLGVHTIELSKDIKIKTVAGFRTKRIWNS